MDGWVCEECTVHSTRYVCCCSSPPKQICKACFSTHNAKTFGDVHGLLPAEILDGGDDLADVLYNAKHKLVDLTNVSHYLEESLKDLNGLLHTFNSAVEKLVKRIYKHRDRVIKEVKEFTDLLESRIKPSVEEMLHHVVDPQFSPLDPLEQLIWTFKSPSEGNHGLVIKDWHKQFEAMTNSIHFDIKT